MTPGNAASAVAQPVELTPENAELLAGYADHLEHSPLTGHSPRTYLGAIRAYLTLFQNQADRWKTGRDLTNAQRVDLAVYDADRATTPGQQRRPGRGRRTLAWHHRDGAGQIRPVAGNGGAAARPPA